MPDPVADWHKEHEHFRTVLSLLQKELDVFQAGGQPGYGLALDIICWLRDFGDTFHHPRGRSIQAARAAAPRPRTAARAP